MRAACLKLLFLWSPKKVVSLSSVHEQSSCLDFLSLCLVRLRHSLWNQTGESACVCLSNPRLGIRQTLPNAQDCGLRQTLPNVAECPRTLPNAQDCGSLFVVNVQSSQDNWEYAMWAGMDATGRDTGPYVNANPLISLYFVLFMVVGSFFVVQLFVGVFMDTFQAVSQDVKGLSRCVHAFAHAHTHTHKCTSRH